MYVIALLLLCNIVLTSVLIYKLFGKTAEERLDDEVERESARRSREMDEGFDNLMRYSVRGMDGFGGIE